MKGLMWKFYLVIAAIVLAFYFSVPTIFGKIPPEIQRFFLKRKIRLGLDLKGGTHFVLQVQSEKVLKEVFERYLKALSSKLSDEKIEVKEGKASEEGFYIVLPQDADVETVADIARQIHGLLKIVSSSTSDGNLRLTFDLPPSEKADIKAKALEQALETIRNRIDQFGVVEPTIVKYGEDMIVVQLPGIKDPERAKGLIQKTGLLEFKLVDDENRFLETLADKLPEGVTLQYEDVRDRTGRVISVPFLRSGSLTKLSKFVESIKDQIPEGNEILIEEIYHSETGTRTYRTYLLKAETLLKGDTIDDARVRFDTQFGQPYVSLSFNSSGAKIFEEITGQNVGRRLAIILDGRVKSAPVIKTRIPGGKAVIEGRFTSEEAHDLAITLRAGSLPAPIEIAEERTVGPSLGSDSIRKGLRAVVIGAILIVFFMAFYYKLSGVIADIALLLNLFFIIAIMSIVEATLTLPGIAGLVLTLGMAVDANILIIERMREELRTGKTARAAVEAGYEKAFSAIFDSNITTVVAAAILFQFGTGPIKGFAVTLTVGIMVSFFTAVFITRIINEYLLTKAGLREISV